MTDRLRSLDDDLIVYPGHTAGSSCGKNLGENPTTTIGQERLFNYAFQARSRDSFVRMVLDRMPPAPTYYPVMKQVNKQGAVPLETLCDPAPIQSAALPDLLSRGAMIIDTRRRSEFAQGHVPGVVWAGLGSDFVGWMGWLAPFNQDLVLILKSSEQFPQALLICGESVWIASPAMSIAVRTSGRSPVCR